MANKYYACYRFARMKKIALILSIIASSTALPFHSFAWGKEGHNIVGDIAFSYLDNKTKKEVRKYLGALSAGEAANWMDEMRSNHKYDYMKTWHYVNIEKGKQYTPTKEDNIVNALNKAISALEHKDQLTEDQIRMHLLVIFHLVGDFHQPLHTGYGDDRGGNSIEVTFMNRSSNLHRVWDSEIIEKEHISASDCMKLDKNFSKEQMEQFKTIKVESWIQQPRALLNNVYAFDNKNIDEKYVGKNKAVVEQQLLIAGIRLSAVLEHIFKS
jgi:S1/P1 Nuclease